MGIWRNVKLAAGCMASGAAELRSYLMTQSHQAQRDLVHFPIQAMWDAMNKCEGISLKLQPMAVLYLGERQNLWYRSALHLEEMAIPPPAAVPNQKGGNKALQQQLGSQQQLASDVDPSIGMNQMIHGVLWSSEESLQRMYTALGEDDFASAVWQLRGSLGPKMETTVSRPMMDFRAALGYERQGLYYDAKESYEKAMDNFLVDHREKSAHESEFGELQVLSERYAEVLKQLNQWPALYNVAKSEAVDNPCLALEAAWHLDSFDVVPGLLMDAEKRCPPREELNFGFAKAYNALHRVLKEGLNSPQTSYKDEGVDRLIEGLQQMCIKAWRHLPRTGTMAHKPLIEMATRVSDLKELLTILPALHNPSACQLQHVALLKNMVKNWKLRVPGNADDLRFWGEITDLRSQVLTHVINLSTSVSQQLPNVHQEVAAALSTFPILSIHTISQNYFHFSKAARMQQVPKFALEILTKVQTLPVVPLIDCFERVKNHVLACLTLFEHSNQPSDLQSALAAIEGVTMQFFTKEMYADLTALRSQVCIKMMKVDEGHKLIAAAVQMFDNCNEGWLRFGDYYEMLFQKTPGDLMLAKQAVVSYIFGSRSSCDSVARECCAKMIALLNCDDASGIISSAFVEAITFIPPIMLVFWVPQLIHLMMREETANAACVLLTHVAKQNPQPVYLHVRTYFYQMKALDRCKDSKSPMGASIASPIPDVKPVPKRRRTTRDSAPIAVEDIKTEDVSGDGTTIRASAFLKNCVTIMAAVRDSQPTICNALESFANQIFSITMSPDRWGEELHAYLILALKRCYALSFEHKERVMKAEMTPSMIQFINTIVRSFGTGVYQEPGVSATTSTGNAKGFYGDVASEAINKRAQSLQSSSEYNKIKKDFLKDFDSGDLENLKLQAMVNKLKKWIRNFEKVIKTHTSHCYLDANHRPLTNFTNLTADIELPGDHSMQRNLNVIKVVQILPRMDVVIKHNLVCRRLYFINNVGDTIPYLIMADNANNVQGRKEERILQTFMALNPILDEFPEASRRALKFYVPKITPVAPAVRLMEDNQASVCLFDIYKNYCDKKNIDSDGPIIKYYEKLVANGHRNQGAASVHSSASHGGSPQAVAAVLRDCLKEIQTGLVQSRVLRDYFWKLYSSADEYFLFRKTFIRSHAALCVAEYVLRLTKLTPDMMHIHTESGVEGVYSYTFDLDERNGELVPRAAVPFRLTQNLTEIFTCYGVTGPLQQSMVATARALKQYEQKFKANVKTIFWDELTYWMVYRKEVGMNQAFSEAIQVKPSDKSDPSPSSSSSTATPTEPHLPTQLRKGVNKMLADLQEISQFNGHESAALRLIMTAKSPDNLCRMDPSWHPWL
ncbi:Transformation/transcription domain-associated protein [Hypsibius exemplaris]|uniref:Transformation/transcription domain-associated protein n=1 Tax=Hypsibius exemplaris TaxID=2072580 RepID=A0A1W0WAI7_HYPEX|nr:Transformation/transcription domain-associated protein [Hypsibius exemplaris]